MAEYIEREWLLEAFGEEPQIWIDEAEEVQANDDWHAYTGIVKAAPAADVVPVVHGRWVGLEYDGYADGYPVYDLWECSVCGEEVSGEDVPTTHPWCHGCGARMDGE